METRIHYFSHQDLLADHLATKIQQLATQCISAKGRFSVVLAGGSTPQAVYRRLPAIETDWRHWHIYFGDERFLPGGDLERNDTMAAREWLNHVSIPTEQVHSVPEADTVEAATAAYASILASAPRFDLVLLGLGEDGHTASLFPGMSGQFLAAPYTIAVTDAPKAPPQRVSMSPQCLGNADAIWFIVTGENKRQALTAWLDGANLPPRHIEALAGIDIYTDLASA